MLEFTLLKRCKIRQKNAKNNTVFRAPQDKLYQKIKPLSTLFRDISCSPVKLLHFVHISQKSLEKIKKVFTIHKLYAIIKVRMGDAPLVGATRFASFWKGRPHGWAGIRYEDHNLRKADDRARKPEKCY